MRLLSRNNLLSRLIFIYCSPISCFYNWFIILNQSFDFADYLRSNRVSVVLRRIHVVETTVIYNGRHSFAISLRGFQMAQTWPENYPAFHLSGDTNVFWGGSLSLQTGGEVSLSPPHTAGAPLGEKIATRRLEGDTRSLSLINMACVLVECCDIWKIPFVFLANKKPPVPRKTVRFDPK